MTTFDKRCALLAASFLDEEPAFSHNERLKLEERLAQHLQSEIDRWMEYEVSVIRMSARRGESRT